MIVSAFTVLPPQFVRFVTKIQHKPSASITARQMCEKFPVQRNTLRVTLTRLRFAIGVHVCLRDLRTLSLTTLINSSSLGLSPPIQGGSGSLFP